MDKHIVKVSDQAREQLVEIGKYVAWKLKEPVTAAKLLRQIENEIFSLATFPKRNPLTEEEPWHTQGVRRMPVRNFLVYYVVLDETHEVEVIAVIYARRDQKRALGNL